MTFFQNSSFETIVNTSIDSGITPSDTIMRSLDDLGVNTDFAQHSDISNDYSEFENAGSVDVEYLLSVYSNSYGLSATDSIIRTITID